MVRYAAGTRLLGVLLHMASPTYYFMVLALYHYQNTEELGRPSDGRAPSTIAQLSHPQCQLFEGSIHGT